MFGATEAMNRVIYLAKSLVEDAFAPFEPTEIHKHYEPRELASVLAKAQSRYIQSKEVDESWTLFFEQTGMDCTDATRDRLILRFQPPTATAGAENHRSTTTLGFHRDSWGTNLYEQVNWWAPVFPVSTERTLGLFPNLFATVLPNDSAEFDLPELVEQRRISPASVKPSAMIPGLNSSFEPGPCVPVVISVGEIIAFSGAHAHHGIPNTTDQTRISLDTRTIRVSDYRLRCGAQNIDGYSRWSTPGMFRQMEGEARLNELVGLESVVPYHR